MCDDIDEVMRTSEVIVVGKPEKTFKAAVEPYLGQKPVFDLVRIASDVSHLPENYDGICW
jgi:hypothetical protein